MKKKILCLTLGAFLLSAPLAWAEDSAQKLTLDESIRLALENNLNIHLADKNIQIAKKDYTAAKNARWGGATINNSYTDYENGNEIYADGVNVSIPLYSGGKLEAQQKAQKYSWENSKKTFQRTVETTIYDTQDPRTAVVNGSYTVTDYDVRLSFKRDKYFEIDPYTDQDYFLYINIPEKLAAQFEKAEFTIGFNNDMSIPVTEWKIDGTKVTPTDNLFCITGPGSTVSAERDPEQAALEAAVGLAPSDSNSSDSKVKTIVLGDVIDTDDFTFTLNNVELTYELKPQNTSSVYTSYSADSGKVYIHVDGQYYNKAKRDICIRDLFVPTADYDNGYTYKGFAVTDKDDNSFTWASSYVVCTPLETCHYHGLIECPKVVDETEAPLVVYLEIGGDTYQYTVR